MPEETDPSSGTNPEAPRLVLARAATPPPVPPGQASQFSQPEANPLRLDTFPVVATVLLHYVTCGLFPMIWLNLTHGRLPKVRSDDPSAGRAVGFCFIPFFNFYWIFFTNLRLCDRIDEQRELYGLPRSNLRGLAITACIFQVIPYINFLIGYPFIWPIYIGMMQSSINQLARQSATTAPRAVLPQQPASPGLPGWAVALIAFGCMVPIVAILSAMLLPALAAAKRKAQMINSVNNLKQIGLAFRIWENEHNNQFPFNVPQAQGGTLELCDPDGNGYERDPSPVFKAMSAELDSPRILVSPNDPTKHAAINFTTLSADNISYELHTGANVNESNPEEVLMVDPINGIVLRCDGSVLVDRKYRTANRRY